MLSCRSVRPLFYASGIFHAHNLHLGWLMKLWTLYWEKSGTKLENDTGIRTRDPHSNTYKISTTLANTQRRSLGCSVKSGIIRDSQAWNGNVNHAVCVNLCRSVYVRVNLAPTSSSSSSSWAHTVKSDDYTWSKCKLSGLIEYRTRFARQHRPRRIRDYLAKRV